MAPSFVFNPPSDEEIEHSEAEDEEQDVDEEEEEEEEGEDNPSRQTQSPWDFSACSGSVAEEHARRSTTSIDFKISKALQKRPLPVSTAFDDGNSSESEPEIQEDNKSEDEDEDDVPTNAGDSQSYFASSEGVKFQANSFMELNLSRPLLRACEALGYTQPTPIQAACIPAALNGRDICGSAITGSGKTAAFSLPTLERLLFRPKRIPAIRVLILTPTRELAAQIVSMIEKLAQFTDIRCCLIVGGLSIKVQEAALRSLPDIVVATPGRMIDHLRNSMSVDLDDLSVLILDEADRLLELGFSAEIQELVRLCPKRRQTMLFSATMTEEVNDLVKLSLKKPMLLKANSSAKRPSTLTEQVVRIRRMRRVNQEAVLFALCSKTFTSKVIIFCGTKQASHRLKILFGLAGFKAAELHGDLTQVQRLEALELFRRHEVDFLIATDIAARGLDIIGVNTVINYACPRDLNSYVHRVGRTARAGRKGYAVTFVTDDDWSLLKQIAKKAGSKMQNRLVADNSITNWLKIIEEMEDQVAEILQEEREEMALRKAQMEVTKAENMIAHKDEIFSRPKRTWFVTEKEKKLAKAAVGGKENSGGNEVISAQQAEDIKMKEKRKREREKHLPRKKRRKLEAAREMLEEEYQSEKSEGRGKNKEKSGMSLVDLAYRRAKSVKAKKKAADAGKIVMKPKSSKKSKHSSQRSQSGTEKMQDLFESDMSERKQKTNVGGAGKKKFKHSSFNSKSRYKRR
ncbi:hypothetical protein UlMin_034070 [Ulmus minor]